jgi:hypothetical protein
MTLCHRGHSCCESILPHTRSRLSDELEFLHKMMDRSRLATAFLWPAIQGRSSLKLHPADTSFLEQIQTNRRSVLRSCIAPLPRQSYSPPTGPRPSSIHSGRRLCGVCSANKPSRTRRSKPLAHTRHYAQDRQLADATLPRPRRRRRPYDSRPPHAVRT